MSTSLNKTEKRSALMIFMCFIAYTVSYIGRLACTANLQNMIDGFKIYKSEASIPGSAFFFCYAIGQVLNSLLCDKVNSRKIVSAALLVSSGITASVFFTENIIIISVLWGLNGLVLSALWCNLIGMLAKVQGDKYVSVSITAMSLTIPAGTIFAYSVSALFTHYGIWKFYFLIAAFTIILGAVLFFFFAGKAEKHLDRTMDIDKSSTVTVESKPNGKAAEKEPFFKLFALCSVPIIFAAVFSSLVKDGITSWMVPFFTTIYSVPTEYSMLFTIILPILGIFAAMLSKLLIKKTGNIFKSIIIAWAGCAVLLTLIAITIQFDLKLIVLSILAFSLISCFSYTVNNILTSIIPLYYKSVLRSGSASGIINSFCYVGSTMSMFLLGWIIDNFGWNTLFTVLIVLSVIGIAMSFVGVLLLKRNKKLKGYSFSEK